MGRYPQLDLLTNQNAEFSRTEVYIFTTPLTLRQSQAPNPVLIQIPETSDRAEQTSPELLDLEPGLKQEVSLTVQSENCSEGKWVLLVTPETQRCV